MDWLYVFSNDWFAFLYKNYSLLILNLAWIIPAILKSIAVLDGRVDSNKINDLLKIWGSAKKPDSPSTVPGGEVTK
jgi:hypothetical protein